VRLHPDGVDPDYDPHNYRDLPEEEAMYYYYDMYRRTPSLRSFYDPDGNVTGPLGDIAPITPDMLFISRLAHQMSMFSNKAGTPIDPLTIITVMSDTLVHNQDDFVFALTRAPDYGDAMFQYCKRYAISSFHSVE
jgi:hypothetical protein